LRRILPNTKDQKARWLCQCDCGNQTISTGRDLRAGHTKSCGCLQKDKARQRLIKHGESKQTKEYSTWCNMKNRCYNKNDANYHYYGARGIQVCSRWLQSFENFLFDVGRSPSVKHTLDRIDNSGDYEPSNCRWATRLKQSNNTRKNIIIGEESLSEYCRRVGKNYSTIKSRLRRGWSIQQVVNTPVGAKR
jgi:hypothetical protein